MIYVAYALLIVACTAMFYFDMLKREDLDKRIDDMSNKLKLLETELLKVKSDNKKVAIVKRTKSHDKPSV